jgi:hypothetical protein
MSRTRALSKAMGHTDGGLARRKQVWVQPEPRFRRGFLTVYHQLALPVERDGGIPIRI